MSVLIKGMEMPENCFDCHFMYCRKYCLANSKIEFNDPEYSELKGRYDGCPLVPVPEPHGRLIDADAFTRRIKEEEDKCATTGCKADRYLIPGYRATTKFANDFPTVIPASEVGDYS